MKPNFIIPYIIGFLKASKMILEYPYIEKLWEHIHLEKKQINDVYVVIGLALNGFILGLAGSFVLWLITLIIPGMVGTIIGTILLLLILLLKDKGQGMGLLGSYLASRLSGKKHQQSCKLLDDSNDDDKSLSSVVLSLILLLKIAMCFVIIKNNCEYMLLPLLMVNYCTQGLLAGNRRINNNVLFYLELHDLDNFYIASAILLFVGVHLNFVVWLFTLFVFAMQYLFAARFTEDSNLYTGNKLTFSGEVSEFVLLIIFSLYLL